MNITNILQWCFMLSNNNLFGSCVPILSGTQLDVIPGEFLLKFTQDKHAFRDIDWLSNIDTLKDIIKSTNKSIVFGVHSESQVDFLKSQFKDNALVITCSYDESEIYDRFLTDIARRHVNLQNLGSIKLNESDKSLTTVERIEHYKKVFAEQELIPTTLSYRGDYDVPVRDLFDKSKLIRHLSNIGVTASTAASEFYDKWYEINEKEKL
jgi:hypothetical protein